MDQLPINKIEKNFQWLNKHHKNLLIIEKDTKDILNNFSIYFAIDCVDILLYLFPYLNIENDKVLQNEDEDFLAKKQLTRYFLFDHMEFSKRTIFPPHLFELNTFFNRFNEFIKKTIFDKEKKKDLISILENINNDKENSHESIKDFINQYKQINYLVMACSQPKSEISMNNKINDKLIKVDKIDENIPAEIFAEIINKENNKYELLFEKRRKSKTLQNYIDAKSLQFCDGINEISLSKKKFYIVSSALTYNVLHDSYPNLPIRPLDVFTTYVSITSDINPSKCDSNKYHNTVLNTITKEINEVLPLLETSNEYYQKLISVCNLNTSDSFNKENICQTCKVKNEVCEELIKISEKIITHKDKIENVKYILGGVLPYDNEMKSRVKLDHEIVNKLNLIISNLKDDNDFLVDIKNRFVIENKFDFLNLLTLVKLFEDNKDNKLVIKIPKSHMYFSELISEFVNNNEDFSLEIRKNIIDIFANIRNENKEEIINCIRNLSIHACNAVKIEVNIYLQLIIYYLCGQERTILDVFNSEKCQNLFNEDNFKKYKPEYYFLYALILHQKIFKDRDIIFKDNDLQFDIKEFFNSIRIYANNDFRFMFQKALMLAIIYEQSVKFNSSTLEKFIFEMSKENYSLDQVESLFDNVLKNIYKTISNYPHLEKRIINNICYIRTLTSSKINIPELMDAKYKLENKFDFPKSINTELPAFVDTYAIVLMKIGIFTDNSNYLLNAKDYFNAIAVNKDVDINTKKEAKQNINKIDEFLIEKKKLNDLISH
jgi:hypothetical protein